MDSFEFQSRTCLGDNLILRVPFLPRESPFLSRKREKSPVWKIPFLYAYQTYRAEVTWGPLCDASAVKRKQGLHQLWTFCRRRRFKKSTSPNNDERPFWGEIRETVERGEKAFHLVAPVADTRFVSPNTH